MNIKLFPQPLRPGDTVALVSTARKVSPQEMKPAIELFRSWGLNVLIPDDLYAQCDQMAGTDEQRARVLQSMINHPEVKAIICARGGYGTVHIVDKVDFSSLTKCPKWIVGYSDVTVLHSHLHQMMAMPTLHATMPINIPSDACQVSYSSTDTLKAALWGEPITYTIEGHPFNREGSVTAPIVGGNLSILYSLCGSASSIDTRGKILFIEDLDEYLYHIDRMMMNLDRCGMLSGLKGLIVGALSDMHDNAIPFGKTAEEIVRDVVSKYDYPVCFGAPFGHIGTENKALILGQNAELVVSYQKKFVHLHFLSPSING